MCGGLGGDGDDVVEGEGLVERREGVKAVRTGGADGEAEVDLGVGTNAGHVSRVADLGNRETGKQGNTETRKQGNKEIGKRGNGETGEQGNKGIGETGSSNAAPAHDDETVMNGAPDVLAATFPGSFLLLPRAVTERPVVGGVGVVEGEEELVFGFGGRFVAAGVADYAEGLA